MVLLIERQATSNIVTKQFPTVKKTVELFRSSTQTLAQHFESMGRGRLHYITRISTGDNKLKSIKKGRYLYWKLFDKYNYRLVIYASLKSHF